MICAQTLHMLTTDVHRAHDRADQLGNFVSNCTHDPRRNSSGACPTMRTAAVPAARGALASALCCALVPPSPSESPKLFIRTLARGLLFMSCSGRLGSELPAVESGACAALVPLLGVLPCCLRLSRDAAERDLRRPDPGGTLRSTPPLVQYRWQSCTQAVGCCGQNALTLHTS